jgi:tRNA A-37 threonylcarbamoyl transferase component Bud32
MSELSASSIAIVEAATGWRDNRVQVLDLPEGRVVIKGQRAKRGPWRYKLLSWLASAVRVPMLQPVPMLGGAQSQALEIRRLQRLHSAGLKVPRVMHVAPDYFVMTHLGYKDMAVDLRERGFAVFPLWEQATQQILAVHAAGEYLSQCFARNIIIEEHGSERSIAGFIDFEDDPLSEMSVLDAQVRDWLSFFQSTIFTLAAPADQLQASLRRILDAEQAVIRNELLAQIKRLVWLQHLPASRKPWGKDVVNVQAACAAFHSQLKLRSLI